MDQEILLALGSNQAFENSESAEVLSQAVREMGEMGINVTRISRFYQTPCFPAGAGPDYVNAAVVVQSDLSAPDLLERLHQIEARLGRERRARWGVRTVDIDLIAHGALVLPDAATQAEWRDLPLERQRQEAPDQLILPHPRLQDRAFVLVPLMDVAPDWHHPITGYSVREMLAALPEADIKEVKAL